MTLALLARRPARQLWIVAGLGWVAVLVLVRAMRPMPQMVPTLGIFLAMWVPMMAAMMLPSVEPVAALYLRTVRSDRRRRLGAFVGGYLVVWSLTGLPAYGLARLGGWLAGQHPAGATALASGVFAACGVYQLTPLKARCLSRCRSPLGQLLHYASYRGRLRDLRVGLHHATWCVGCCWALMVLMIAFGSMNLLAMIALATVVFLEKRTPGGVVLGKAVGVASLLVAVAVLWWPALAPALHHNRMG